ncbi:MAG: PAS domain-containing protein [Bacteroidales bacterium]|nr:PAS domain-containing protein [Bacteroidales bacterium]
MRILLLTILLFLTASANYCMGQSGFVYSNICCKEEQKITSRLYSTNPKDKQLWVKTLIEAEKSLCNEKDLDKVTGSLARIYQLYGIAEDDDGKNRCLQKITHLAESTSNLDIYVRAQIMQAHQMIRHNQIDSAVTIFQKTIKYLEPQKAFRQLAKAYCYIAYTYDNIHNEVLSIRNLLKAVSIVKNQCANDSLVAGEVYINTSLLYLNDGDYSKAEEYITEALSIFRNVKNIDTIMSHSYLNIALIVAADIKRASEDYDTAISLYNEGIKGFTTSGLDFSSSNTFHYLSDAYNGLGITYQKKQMYDEAIKNMLAGFDIRKRLVLKKKIADSYITIADYYTKTQQDDSAYVNFEEGFKAAYSIRDAKLIHLASQGLANYYHKKRDYEKAYKYLEIANNYYQDVLDIRQSKAVAREEMDYIFEEELDYAKRINAEQNAEIKRDKIIIYLAATFCLIAAVMITMIIVLFYKRQKKNRMLQIQRDQLELRSKQLQDQQKEISQKNQELRATTEMLEKSVAELRATTEMLEERNNELTMLSAVASSTGNSIYITNKDGKMIWFNDAFSRETHIPKEELHTHPALKSSSMTPETRITYEKVLATKKTQTYTAEMKHLEGDPFWVQAYVNPVLDDDGEIMMIVWVSTNITELHHAYEKIENQNKEINASISYARRIQDAVQPMKIFSDEILGDHFIINMPRNIVSGDFHWVGYKNGLSVFTVADCTGHGVPGAFISMLGQVMLNQTLSKLEDISSATILNILRTGIIHQLHQREKDDASSDSMDASMFVYDRDNCIIDFAGAYSYGYLLRFGTPDAETEAICNESGSKIIFNQAKDAYLIRLKPNRMTIGIDRRDTIPFTSIKFKVNHGDIAYATTDGYPDQFGGLRQKRFFVANFEKMLLKYCHLSMVEQRKELERTFLEWKGDYEQTDDVHVLGIVL